MIVVSVQRTEITVLILIKRVNVKFLVNAPEMPRIIPPINKQKIITVTVVKIISTTTGKSVVLGPYTNTNVEAPINTVIVTPIM